MPRYRFLDAMGDVVEESEHPDHAAAVAAVADLPDDAEAIYRIDYLGPEGDWRWAGPLNP